MGISIRAAYIATPAAISSAESLMENAVLGRIPGDERYIDVQVNVVGPQRRYASRKNVFCLGDPPENNDAMLQLSRSKPLSTPLSTAPPSL